ncbi:MAG: SIR2 family protein, partial [Deltaproteobacteria bacterium]|nr:SIR2 family protein [Deltaproteobacteria bacterium]
MIFTDDGVDLPNQLLQSLTSDRLVIFVGAGVSMQAYQEQPPDTYYPGFAGLAELIAERLSRAIPETEKEHLKTEYVGRVLGEWDDQKGDVRGRAAAILQENEAGQRLELHRAIIRPFKGNPKPRIVTTNLDRLLIRALEVEGLARGGRWSISVTPALPPARRFTGICYLHGSVDEPQDIVLTDKDIGRAYMDEGWALRFAPKGY